MYYQDLTPYQYIPVEKDPPSLNIGWLDNTRSYPQGEVPEPFVERLWLFCRSPVNQMRGFQECQLCVEPSLGIRLQRSDDQLWLGSAEIRVFSPEGTAYAAPNMIYHYVVDHRYLPPEEFIRAVLEGPLPDTPEYLAHAAQYEWGRRAARERRFRV
jgi:hypothetical protein